MLWSVLASVLWLSEPRATRVRSVVDMGSMKGLGTASGGLLEKFTRLFVAQGPENMSPTF